MIYGIQVTVQESRNELACQHNPVVIETLTMRKNDISIDELNMVASAFARQLEQALKLMSGFNPYKDQQISLGVESEL